MHIGKRIGFRDIYERNPWSLDDWYEERCKLFKYRSVNCAFSDDAGVYIDRRHRRCYRCVYYPICFRLEIIKRKYGSRTKQLRELYDLLLELNAPDEEEVWWD